MIQFEFNSPRVCVYVRVNVLELLENVVSISSVLFLAARKIL